MAAILLVRCGDLLHLKCSFGLLSPERPLLQVHHPGTVRLVASAPPLSIAPVNEHND